MPSTPGVPHQALDPPQVALSSLPPWLWALVAVMASALLNAAIGPVAIPPGIVVRMLLSRLPHAWIEPSWPATFTTILYQIRLPHTALMALCGMALGGSGAAYQGLFRNPLADPYIIGVASGAGFGAVAAMAAGWPETALGLAAIPLAAFVGALITVLFVYNLARVGRAISVTTLILAGVAAGSFLSALTSLILLITTHELRRAILWLLGGFQVGGWEPSLVMLPYLTIGLALLALLGRSINVLQYGDEQATQLGLNVGRIKTAVIVAASLVAATAVSFSGIIAFVGLVVPHLVRLMWGPDYRRLIPLATLGGGTVLLMADIVARVALAPRDLPVGIVTSLIGAPFFLWLLHRARERKFDG